MAPYVGNSLIGAFRIRNTTVASRNQPHGDEFEFIQYECHPGFRMASKLSVVTCNQETKKWSDK